jgi:hypothetical protein
MRRTYFAAAGALALIVAAGPVLAQAPTPFNIGATVEGELIDQDAQSGEDYRYDDYALRLRAGQRLEAVLRAPAFDAYLALFRDGVTAGEPLAADDDGLGEGTHSRLRFGATETGTYILRARTLSGLTGGSYSLAVTERPRGAPAPRPTALGLGRTLEGQLAETDPEQDDGSRYDAYSFRARAGDRVAVSLNADDFDPVVLVGRMNRGVFTELGRNDDAAGGGLNSMLVFTAPGNGDYVIRATALTAEGYGAYTIGLAEGPPPAPVASIAIGDAVEGELNASDGTNDEGARTDSYRFTARAGQRLLAEMASETFDTYLELFHEADGVRTSVAEDDDGAGSGTNSRLDHEIQTAGDYVLEARAFGDGEGAYSLSLTETAPEPPPAQLAFGAVTQGEIAEGDPGDASGKAFDAYGFSGEEGRRVQAIMRSGDFDTYLEIGRPGGAFTALVSDDDGLGEGTDSRLNFILPETGDYVLRASPLLAEGTGLYSIELIDRGPRPQPGSILVGATARGSLSDADTIGDEGAYFDAYELHAKAGEKLRITLVSNAFDSFVEVGRQGEDGAFESLGSDDDGLSDTHARFEWTAPSDEVYVIRARSFAPGQTGDYALTVERKP